MRRTLLLGVVALLLVAISGTLILYRAEVYSWASLRTVREEIHWKGSRLCIREYRVWRWGEHKGSTHGTEFTRYPDGRLHTTGRSEFGVVQGVWTRWNADGTVEKQDLFVDGEVVEERFSAPWWPRPGLGLGPEAAASTSASVSSPWSQPGVVTYRNSVGIYKQERFLDSRRIEVRRSPPWWESPADE